MASQLKYLALAILAIFAPIQTIIMTVGCLIIMDAIVGILAARKRGEKITSAALRRTVSKAVIYQVAICSGFLTEHYLTGDFVPITKILASIIGMVELKSILENADEINGVSIFKSLADRLGSQNDTERKQ